MTIKDLRTRSKMTQKQFAEYFGIPQRSIENWEGGQRKCPQYLIDLMEYKLKNENKKIYLICNDSMDDYCDMKGYITGSEEEADKYCDDLNRNNKYEWQDYTWELLDDLNETK